MRKVSGIRFQASGLAGLMLVLMFGFSGFACAREQDGDAQGERGYAASRQAGATAVTERTHASVVQASTSAGTIGDAGQYRDDCRIQTYIFKEDMSKAEVRDFTARITYRVQANLNGGSDKNLGELLDDIDVPSYKGLCG